MTPPPSQREALTCGVATVLQAVRGMGRVMLSVSGRGATHERIGVVDAVLLDNGAVCLAGAAHDARIDLSEVAGVIADRSGRMKDKAMPRLDFQDAGGTTLFSLIGLEGLEPFDRALAAVGPGTPLPQKERPAPSGGAGPTEVAEDDEGARPLKAARASGEPIGLVYRGKGLEQRWTGTVAEVRPAMGFINIIQPDFHLHLKAGAVARWRRETVPGGIALTAEDVEGREIGLTLTGPASLA